MKKIGICITGQSKNLVPADKKIYALRDTIACTDSIPLIASSIMSKKIAAGADKIVLEVTFGKGAFMKTKEDAIKLCNIMIKIGKLTKKETICIITNMEEPLGMTVGNNLEIIEAINSLNGNMPKDVKEVIEELGAYIIKLAGKGNNILENKKRIEEVIENKQAFLKFCELIEKQGGDVSYIKNTSKFEKAKYIIPVLAEKEGYISEVNAEIIGNVSARLGAGRMKKEDKIDHLVGIVLNKKVGDRVEKGETLCFIHASNEKGKIEAVDNVKKAFNITAEKVAIPKTILGIVE